VFASALVQLGRIREALADIDVLVAAPDDDPVSKAGRSYWRVARTG
jgi:hypothetical protein